MLGAARLSAVACAMGVCAFTTVARAESPSVLLDPDWTLTLDGQFRPRVLFNTGRDFQGDVVSNREYVTQRARLGFTMEKESGLQFTLRLQDVRIWGEERDTLNDFSADGFDAHEVFVKVPLTDGLSFKVGRQEILLDAQRLVGAVGWSQRGRSFDAARLDFTSGVFSASTFYAKIRESEAYADGHVDPNAEDDIDFGGLHTQVDFAKGHKVATLYLINANHGFNDAGAEHLRHTAGLFADGKAGGFSYTAEGYYQFGRMDQSKIAAWMGALRAGYTLDVPGKPSLLAWGELLSGDGTPQGAFDTLYATNHGYYGEMDFFIGIPANTANLGLMDLGGRLGASATDELKLNVDFHHFRSVESDTAGTNAFGNEIDGKVQWAATENLTLRALYGVFLPSDTMRAPKKLPQDVELKPEQFAYLEMDATF